ncbi:diguanylate cyclase (GGDEF)-like protein [Tumebacillus sp. BK434]|uniref:GGDEF domain-containing protein n=1 Tax=Tumebacillus sp. BK434 TaxID=2512169 RepID=UPI001046F5F0|nr:GGDEF domain-containing protein [Tumebacillus sp. BK434]TCP59193.1 diguanylate cyclase (GGDEF)-like protein [Tumebacillus sp. BK434]
MTFSRLAGLSTAFGLALLVTALVRFTQPVVSLSDAPILLTLFVLYAMTELFRLKRNHFVISLSLSVDLLIFLKFGLAPVVLMSQFIFFFARWYQEGKVEFWKVLANSGMFLSAAGCAAIAFYVTGGSHQALLHDNYVPLLSYICVHYLANHLFLYLFYRTMHVTQDQSYVMNVKFDLFSTLFATSLGVVVILLYEQDGLQGLLAFGLPLVLCVYVFKLFNDLYRSSSLFRNLTRLTGYFSGELAADVMFGRVTKELPKWFEHVHCVIFVREEDQLVVRSTSDGMTAKEVQALEAYLRVYVPNQEAPTLRQGCLDQGLAKHGYNTLLISPFKGTERHVGFCCLIGTKKSEFDATTLDAISILANQLTVSYRNAMRYANMEKQSLYDELTELPNHRFLERRLAEEMERITDAPLSLLLIDLDHFKQVNDRYGHLAGNAVLERAARLFEDTVRKSDFVARYGGEEFLVLLPGANRDVAAGIAEQIRARMAAEKFTVPTLEGETLHIETTVSIGVATYPSDAEDGQQLLRYADRAMYYGAKRAGRNRVAVYRQDDTPEDAQ